MQCSQSELILLLPQVFAVLTWRVTPDAFLANQLLNLCDLDAAFHVLQQIRPQIQVPGMDKKSGNQSGKLASELVKVYEGGP